MIEDILSILNAYLKDVSNLSAFPAIMGDTSSFLKIEARFNLSNRA